MARIIGYEQVQPGTTRYDGHDRYDRLRPYLVVPGCTWLYLVVPDCTFYALRRRRQLVETAVAPRRAGAAARGGDFAGRVQAHRGSRGGRGYRDAAGRRARRRHRWR